MVITNWERVVGAIALDNHSARHEDGGADEISVEALSGLLADDQHVLDSELDTWLSTKEADYAPSAMSVDTGTLDAGAYTDLAALGGTDVAISETSGADPLRVTLTFPSVILVPNNVLIYGYYAGGQGHHLNCEVYNTLTTNWDLIGILDYETAKMWYSFPMFNGSVYVDGSNDVQVRLRHDQTGNINHDLHLDYFIVQRSFGTGGGAAAVLDAPADGEAHIAISANWAYDHDVDVDAHHAQAHASNHTDGTDDVADLVGANGGAGTHGLVPAPSAGDAAAGKFLKADASWDVPAGGAGTDGDAIHDNVASEISAITEKGAPVSADLVIIEDSEASNVKKRVQVGNLPAGEGLSEATVIALILALS